MIFKVVDGCFKGVCVGGGGVVGGVGVGVVGVVGVRC